MAGLTNLSRCSSNREINFHWFDGLQPAKDDPIEEAVDRCFEAVQGENRLWNPHNAAMIRAEFRRVLKDACKGVLVPVDQVKEAGHDPTVPLYEIRWQHGIQVTYKDPATGQISHPSVLVRMYHSEPISEPDYFIGHHVHEKQIGVDDKTTSRLQTEEISIAQRKYRLGENYAWGISN